jgi:hypothetical protein
MAGFGIPRPRRGSNDNERPPLNWRRGLFRVWAVISIAWIMAWVIYLLIYGVREGFRGTADYLTIPIVLIGPPVALLIFGLAVRWAFQGFAADRR